MKRYQEILKDLLARPTAPFREGLVREYIAAFCRQRGIDVRVDGIGNVIATYGGPNAGQVFAFTAHMDHPGFIIEKDSRGGRTTAVFYGGVEESYFPGSVVRIFSELGPVRGVVTKTQFDRKKQSRRVWLELEDKVSRGDMGMWDLSSCRVRGDRLYSRACDDLVGCGAILCLLEELLRRKIRPRVMAVFTVAEEAGMHGARYVCQEKGVPEEACLIAIETSKVLPTVRMGEGVVIRVGDRVSVFTPAVTAFMVDCARQLSEKDRGFRYRRQLMDGGTCESTIYTRYGYRNGAVCIPLGNYHNRNERHGKIAMEYVSQSDFAAMVELFVAMVRKANDLPGYFDRRPERLAMRTRELGEQVMAKR